MKAVSCMSRNFFEGRYHNILTRISDFDKSHNMNKVGLIHQLTRDLWNTGKSVIIYRELRDFKGIL